MTRKESSRRQGPPAGTHSSTTALWNSRRRQTSYIYASRVPGLMGGSSLGSVACRKARQIGSISSGFPVVEAVVPVGNIHQQPPREPLPDRNVSMLGYCRRAPSHRHRAEPITSNRCAILAWGYSPEDPPPPAFHASSKAIWVSSINSST